MINMFGNPQVKDRSIYWMTAVFIVSFFIINLAFFIYDWGSTSTSYTDLPGDILSVNEAILTAWLAAYYIARRTIIKKERTLKISVWFGVIAIAPYLLGIFATIILYFQDKYQYQFADEWPGLVMNIILFVITFSTTYLMLKIYSRALSS